MKARLLRRLRKEAARLCHVKDKISLSLLPLYKDDERNYVLSRLSFIRFNIVYKKDGIFETLKQKKRRINT